MVTLFNFSYPFTIYNLNDSYVIYKSCSTFHKKHVGLYSEEFFTILNLYNLNNSYFIYELCSKFQQNNWGSYSKEIDVFKCKKFHLFVTFFFFFTLFIVYKLNDSYFIYKNGSIFQKKHVGYYLEDIVVFQFENFHLLVTLF